MRKVLLFLFGSICFKAQGGFPERFLNLCALRGVKLHALKSSGGVLYAETSLSSFRKMRTCAAKSAVKVRITEKKGLPFFYAKLAPRTGLFIGAALCCFLLFFYSRSIWSIQVRGNENIPAQRILLVLEQNGVRPGVFKKNLSLKKLTFQVYEALPEVAWLNITADGSRLNVNLRETVQKPDSRDSGSYCNVVAAKAGVVDRIQVYEGEATVREGDGVSEGEMLVSGVMYHENTKQNTFHRAAADIYAFTACKHCIRIPKQMQKTRYTGEKKTCAVLQLFRLRLPLYIFTPQSKNCEVSVVQKPLSINGTVLPLSLTLYEYRHTQQSLQTLTAKQAAVLARAKKATFEKTFADDTRILRTTHSLEQTDKEYVFYYRYALYENIAKLAAIEIDDKNVNNNMENKN